jgi:hypothetical protein
MRRAVENTLTIHFPKSEPICHVNTKPHANIKQVNEQAGITKQKTELLSNEYYPVECIKTSIEHVSNTVKQTGTPTKYVKVTQLWHKLDISHL